MEMMYFLLPDEGYVADHIVYIGITGSPSYRIALTFDHSLAQRMTMDLLNVEQSDITDDLTEQTLKETANIIAGNLLHSFDVVENRNLTLPYTQPEQVFGDMKVEEHETFSIYFEGQKVAVLVETLTLTQ
jgi:CheY-specific phosphatase CheX